MTKSLFGISALIRLALIRLVCFTLPESTACRLCSWLDFPISDPNPLIRYILFEQSDALVGSLCLLCPDGVNVVCSLSFCLISLGCVHLLIMIP